MQIEHVAGERFAAGRALQDERNLAVGDGVLGEVVVNDERIHAVFHEPFADGGAGVRREVLVGGIVSSGGGDDHGVLERTGGLESADRADDVGALLTDRDVDRVNGAEVLVAGGEAHAIDLRLVDDRIDGDGGLAGAAVADDQLALAAADRDHGVDRHDAGEERLGNGFADDDAGSDALDGIELLGVDRAFAIDGTAEGIDHAAEQGLAHGHGEEAAGRLDLIALLQVGDIAEHHAADLVFLEVERHADGAAWELHHLVVHHVGQAVELGHAIGDGGDRTGVLFDRLVGELGDLLFDLFENGAHGAGTRLRAWLLK